MAADNKTEKPTPQRILKARREGNFASSREMVAAFQFLSFVLLVSLWFPSWLRGMREMLRRALITAMSADLNVATLPALMERYWDGAVGPLVMIGAITSLATLAMHLAMTRMGFSLKKMAIDFKRFNPAGKIKNMARQGPAGLMQAVAMLALFSAAIYTIARNNATLIFSLPFMSLDVGLQKVGASLADILWKAVGLFLVFGFIDLVRQKRHLLKDLRMTKQEVKEEIKDSEGNPHVKGKIRRAQRDMARRRMMQEVATATAVIVNPTHFAVALRYDHATMPTPVVVAKGKNYLALRIRQRALNANVPLVENPPLAQALYKSVDVGREIPPQLYRAVAEVLSYIYRLTGGRL